MTSQRYFLLGLFFLAVIGILGYYTLFMTHFTLFDRKPRMVVYFAEAGGLSEGDSVLVAGMRWGRVDVISFDQGADLRERITVTLRLDDPLNLRRGAQIYIEDATLLGGHKVTIDPGLLEADPIPPNERLYGEIRRNVLESVGEFFDDSGGRFDNILEGIEGLVLDARAGRGLVGRVISDEDMANDLATVFARMASALENLDRVTSGLAEGRGSIGALLAERELYEQLVGVTERLDSVLADAEELTTTLNEGEGLLPRLLNDPKMGADVAESLSQLSELVADVRAGKGTIGTLFTDDAVARNLQTLLAGLAEGRGTLGALFQREDLYDDLAVLADDLAAITTAIRTGQGSLGKLVMDDQLYEDLRITVGLLTRSLEEFREAAPITTFTSVLFGGL